MRSLTGTRVLRAVDAVADAVALVAAVFGLLGVVLGAIDASRNGSWLWAGTLARAGLLGDLVVALFAAAVLGRRRWRGAWSVAARGLALSVAALSAYDAAACYGARLASHAPVPLSLVVAVALGWWALRPLPVPHRRRTRALLAAVTAPALLVLQILAVGATDHRRSADAIVVFGAAVRPDGSPSQALADRVLTACALYKGGYAKELVLSGGSDPRAPRSEPAAMRELAIACGVPDEAIVLDESGANTRATVDNAASLAAARGWQSVLMVSHDYHLSRIQVASRRAGLRAFTVPARESYGLPGKPWYLAREVAAWLAYYARG